MPAPAFSNMNPFARSAMSACGAALVLLAGNEAHSQGLKLRPDDLVGDKGITSAPAPSTFSGSVIHHMSWRDKVPPQVGDQGADFSCVGWTLGYGLLSAITGRQAAPFSPYYIYRWGLEYTAEKDDEDNHRDPITPHNGTQSDWPLQSGIDFWAGFLVFSAQGCCSAPPPHATIGSGTIHFDDLTQAMVTEGHGSRVFIAPSRMDQKNIVDNIKKELTSTYVNGQPGLPHPVPCAFYIHNHLRENAGLEDAPKANKKHCLWTKDCRQGERIMHAMLIVGYDDDFIAQGQGAFEVMNSFGPGCGDNGFIWISYDLMAQVGSDPNDRSQSPCCVAAWSYILTRPIKILEKGFGAGTDPGWVRLQDTEQKYNFKTATGPISAMTDLHKGDKLVAKGPVAVRAVYKAVGQTDTTAGQLVKKLKHGDSVVIEDYHVLTRGAQKEIWAKVRLQ